MISGARGVFIGYKCSVTTQQTTFGRIEPLRTELKKKKKPVSLLFARHSAHLMPNATIHARSRGIFVIRLILH
jgi:hypothetical protein